MQEPHQLDYHVPPPSRRAHASMGHFAGQAVIWTFVAIVATVLAYGVLPKFEQVFADFKVTLPALTLLMIRAARWLRFGGIAVFWVMPLAAPFVLSRIVTVDEAGRPSRRAMAMIRLATLILLILVALIGGYAIFAPLAALIQSMVLNV